MNGPRVEMDFGQMSVGYIPFNQFNNATRKGPRPADVQRPQDYAKQKNVTASPSVRPRSIDSGNFLEIHSLPKSFPRLPVPAVISYRVTGTVRPPKPTLTYRTHWLLVSANRESNIYDSRLSTACET
ncbi:unnamed protein product [Soboliphyme baturini]|uniref:Uncharacterized protein n=1 Tax=Soboliphyme baturini TaxID=241478 RepID=A0A183IUP6_9BILA|nr:unnamed protein product [Soboliphyme baturini]